MCSFNVLFNKSSLLPYTIDQCQVHLIVGQSANGQADRENQITNVSGGLFNYFSITWYHFEHFRVEQNAYSIEQGKKSFS